MAGIYGDSLIAWPEQQQTFQTYSMTPKINAGWTIDEDSEQTIVGIFQHTREKQLKDSNGNLINSEGGELWTASGGQDGRFIKIENKVFRLNVSNNWSKEGGFYRYGLEMVVGNNGTEHDNTTWNFGRDTFN